VGPAEKVDAAATVVPRENPANLVCLEMPASRGRQAASVPQHSRERAALMSISALAAKEVRRVCPAMVESRAQAGTEETADRAADHLQYVLVRRRPADAAPMDKTGRTAATPQRVKEGMQGRTVFLQHPPTRWISPLDREEAGVVAVPEVGAVPAAAAEEAAAEGVGAEAVWPQAFVKTTAEEAEGPAEAVGPAQSAPRAGMGIVGSRDVTAAATMASAEVPVHRESVDPVQGEAKAVMAPPAVEAATAEAV